MERQGGSFQQVVPLERKHSRGFRGVLAAQRSTNRSTGTPAKSFQQSFRFSWQFVRLGFALACEAPDAHAVLLHQAVAGQGLQQPVDL